VGEKKSHALAEADSPLTRRMGDAKSATKRKGPEGMFRGRISVVGGALEDTDRSIKKILLRLFSR